MGGYFDGAKRFNLLDNSLALLALHLACVGLIASHWEKFPPGLNIALPLGCCLFGGVFAVLAVFYGVVNGVSLRKLVELNVEWGDGPPVRPDLTAELRILAWVAAGFAAVMIALAALRLPVWPSGLTTALLAFMVVAPLPLAWKAFSPLVAMIRGGLALLSMLAFVLAVSLPLLPRAVEQTAVGVSAAVAAAAGDTPPAAVPAADRPKRAGDEVRPGAQVGVVPVGSTGSGQSSDPDGASQASGLAGVRQDIDELRLDINAALARPVEVRMGPPTVVEMPTYQPTPLPPQPAPAVTVIGFTGEQGLQGDRGTPGPVRECKPAWALPWFRTCSWVAAPEVGSPAPSGPS